MNIAAAGTVECRVIMELQIGHKTQRRVVLGPGDVVPAVIDCTGETAVLTRCTVAKCAMWTGEEPVDVVLVGKSSARDGYRLVVNDDKRAVMAFGDGEGLNCRQEKNETRSLKLGIVLK